MIKLMLYLVLALYAVGFIGTLWLNMQMPVTPALAFIRATLWPVWLFGGLRGTPLPMD